MREGKDQNVGISHPLGSHRGCRQNLRWCNRRLQPRCRHCPRCHPQTSDPLLGSLLLECHSLGTPPGGEEREEQSDIKFFFYFFFLFFTPFQPFIAPPVAWGSRDRRAPRLRPPRAQRQCDNELAGCPGPPAPWSSYVSGSRPNQPSLHKCSPPSGPGSWCTWGADSWPTSWRWRCHSELWLGGTDLRGHVDRIRILRLDIVARRKSTAIKKTSARCPNKREKRSVCKLIWDFKRTIFLLCCCFFSLILDPSSLSL